MHVATLILSRLAFANWPSLERELIYKVDLWFQVSNSLWNFELDLRRNGLARLRESCGFWKYILVKVYFYRQPWFLLPVKVSRILCIQPIRFQISLKLRDSAVKLVDTLSRYAAYIPHYDMKKKVNIRNSLSLRREMVDTTIVSGVPLGILIIGNVCLIWPSWWRYHHKFEFDKRY